MRTRMMDREDTLSSLVTWSKAGAISMPNQAGS
jgi:hypothetical protein